MCYFITLVLPPSADLTKVESLLKQARRGFWKYDSKHLIPTLVGGEICMFTVSSHCDCDTKLGDRARFDETRSIQKTEKERARHVKEGWSEAKLERWQADKQKAVDKERPNFGGDPDGWSATIAQLLGGADLSYVGLLLHFYSGDQRIERFDFARRNVDLDGSLSEVLWDLDEDELLVVNK